MFYGEEIEIESLPSHKPRGDAIKSRDATKMTGKLRVDMAHNFTAKAYIHEK